jgi:adenosylmethionine-8-amino-7-oxononanoate aminotransferase
MSELAHKDKKYVWHPFTQHFNAGDPLEIVKAKGALLFDSKENSYIDANSSWWVNTHGHGHPYIGDAISKQFNEIDHIVFAGVTHPKAVELAERIVKLMPEDLGRVFFSDNGSTAVEVAMKMVIQYWYNQGIDRTKFVALEGSYHGDTFGAMSVGQRGYFNTPFEQLFFDAEYLPFPIKEKENEILNRAKELFESEKIAGLIVEPLVQGASGMRMYSAGFLDQLTRIARDNGALIIFDEVMTGFGRTGKMFAMDHCEVKPDLVAMSKGLTAGVMALGLTVASNKIYETFLDENISKALLHGHSFTANPLSCSAACANLDLFERPVTWDELKNIESNHAQFRMRLSEFASVSNIRQTGTILAFEVGDSASSYFSDIKTKAYQHFLRDGILLRPLGNVIFINPPYCISQGELDVIYTSVISFLESIQE